MKQPTWLQSLPPSKSWEFSNFAPILRRGERADPLWVRRTRSQSWCRWRSRWCRDLWQELIFVDHRSLLSPLLAWFRVLKSSPRIFGLIQIKCLNHGYFIWVTTCILYQDKGNHSWSEFMRVCWSEHWTKYTRKGRDLSTEFYNLTTWIQQEGNKKKLHK